MFSTGSLWYGGEPGASATVPRCRQPGDLHPHRAAVTPEQDTAWGRELRPGLNCSVPLGVKAVILKANTSSHTGFRSATSKLRCWGVCPLHTVPACHCRRCPVSPGCRMAAGTLHHGARQGAGYRGRAGSTTALPGPCGLGDTEVPILSKRRPRQHQHPPCDHRKHLLNCFSG